LSPGHAVGQIVESGDRRQSAKVAIEEFDEALERAGL
jgi:hypothetical protein